MVGGLAICLLSAQAKNAFMVTLFWWAGIVIAVVGLLILLAKVILWLAGHAQQMIGA